MSNQKVNTNGQPLTPKEQTDSIMMEIAGAESMLGFNPREATDEDRFNYLRDYDGDEEIDLDVF